MSDRPQTPGQSSDDPDLAQALLSTGLFAGSMGFAPNATFQGQLEAMLESLAGEPEDADAPPLDAALFEASIAGTESALADPGNILDPGSLSMLNDLLGLIPDADKLP